MTRCNIRRRPRRRWKSLPPDLFQLEIIKYPICTEVCGYTQPPWYKGRNNNNNKNNNDKGKKNA